MPEIILSERYTEFVALVDDEDYGYLIQWRWTFKRSKRTHNGHIYACRNTWSGGKRIKIMMHNVILERKGEPRPSPEHTGHHKNTKPLDNRRSNLEWATPSKQKKEAWVTRKAKNELDGVPF